MSDISNHKLTAELRTADCGSFRGLTRKPCRKVLVRPSPAVGSQSVLARHDSRTRRGSSLRAAVLPHVDISSARSDAASNSLCSDDLLLGSERSLFAY
ncbi:hypothetical protein J6590_040957 [Homalodisca vitripennis]|nr:hypothetical protein J6590_040957 [Homalodisca vitripennis]